MTRTFLLLLPLTGCSISPQPLPEPAQVFQIDARAIHVSAQPGGTVILEGAARALDPVGPATVRVIDLDGTGSLALAQVRGDGGFSVSLAGDLDDAFRIDVVAQGGRSEPLDFIGDGRGALVRREDCFSLDQKSLALGYAKVNVSVQQSLHLTNECAEELTVRDVIVIGNEGVDPPAISRQTLSSGATARVTLEIAPTKTGDFFSGIILRDASGLHRTVVALEGRVEER